MVTKVKPKATPVASRSNFTKTELEKKITHIMEDKNKEIYELKEEIGELKVKLAKYELGVVIISGEDSAKKQILKFHAQSYNVVEIHNKLSELSITNYTVDQVNKIINNVDLLSSALQLYYKNEVKAYEESVKINPNILKEALIRDNQFLINEIRKLIETTTNEEEKLKYFDRYDRFINTRTKLLSEVVIEKESELDKVDDANSVMENYNTNQLISFKAVKKRVD